MMKIKKAYNFKIISLVLSASFLFTSILYPCPISEDSLRVPSFFQNPESKERVNPKEITKQRIRSAIEAAGGDLTKASKIYYGEKKPQAFYQLEDQYGQLKYAQEITKQRIRSAIEAAVGDLVMASEIYYGENKSQVFYHLAKAYGQLKYAQEIIIQKDAKEITKQRIRSAIEAAGGDLTKASKIYYGKEKKQSYFHYLAQRHGQLEYPKEVTIQKIRSVIETAGGNLTKASKIYYGEEKRSAFHRLAKQYGQLDYAKEITKQRIRSAIEAAGGNLTKASEIYYGRKKPSDFRQLVKRHGQLGYVNTLREILKVSKLSSKNL
jgi:hypothetical protein